MAAGEHGHNLGLGGELELIRGHARQIGGELRAATQPFVMP
jgi:hypothetical protein